MRKGKIGAQCAHASMMVFLKGAEITPGEMKTQITAPMYEWLTNSFTKVCVGVESEAELEEIYQAALAQGVAAAMVVDQGHTEFKGVPTKTVVAIGPDHNDVVDKITAHLKLL